MTFQDIQRLQLGVFRISFQEFDAVLYEAIGASRDYSRNCWPRFRDNPIGYMTSRSPEIQGQQLFQLAWKKGADEVQIDQTLHLAPNLCSSPRADPG